MQDEGIENLLRDADAAVDSPRVPGALAQRVRMVAGKRATRRRYVAAVSIVMLVASVLTVVLEGKKKPELNVAAVRIEIGQLADEAKIRNELADRLWQRERERPKQSRRRVFLAVDPVKSEIDRAAFAMVYQADRMAIDPALREAAERMYRQVSEDFPASGSANVAKQRLAGLVERKDG